MINLGSIGKAITKVVSAPFKAVGKLLGAGGAENVSVSAPDVSATQVVPSTASAVPEAPILGTENTAQDTAKKKKGKSRLLINSDSSPASGNSSYRGLNI